MPKSVFTDAYASLLEVLVATRKRCGVSQVELARRLGKPQPFVSYFERGERRIDVIEFYAIARALRVDPEELFREVVRRLPEEVTI
jgi:transcriptional regulator with XRE-family HTH domain